MTRAISQYPKLNGGVTQRPLREQRMNQLLTMENMVLDPVMGLTRRPGAELVAEAIMAIPDDAAADYRTHEWEDNGHLSVTYPIGPLPGEPKAHRVVFTDHTNGTVQEPTVKPLDGAWDVAMEFGFGAITNVGDLLVATVNTQTPSYETSRPWATPSNQRHHVVWCRGGAYSRTFTVKLLKGNKKCIVSYTTLEATYPAILDTSDLLPSDPDYSKKVNDRTNVYNSQANAWIAEALADIAPENIVTKLAETLRNSGFLSSGATATTDGPYLLINDPQFEEIEADDGGDGNLLRGVGNTVGAPELLTVNGYPGKIVKVRPGQSERGEVFYLQAVAKDKSQGKYTPVTWEECAGEVFTTESGLIYMIMDEGVAYGSSDLAWINDQTGREFSGWQANISGDAVSNPPPNFYGQVISAMTVFQDRLLLTLAGGYVAASQPGDYFNFYRDSAITVLDTDPVTFFVIGGESDTVRHFLTYDRNLLMVGDLQQYLINGRSALKVGSASATVFSKVSGMANTKPAVVEGDLFFTRYNNGYGSMHAMRPGRVAEAPYVTEITEQVNTLLGQQPLQVVAMTTPDLVIVRGVGGGLYIANYVHVEGEQRYAVHTWSMSLDAELHAIVAHEGQLHILSRHVDGFVSLHRVQFQRTSSGTPLRHYDHKHGDTLGQFDSRVKPVAPRLSPEAGNITGTGFGVGAGASSHQAHVIASLDLYFADTAAAVVTVSYDTAHAARTKYYEVN